ncbi:MAG TPA: TonB family protein [Pyrinomonadaceae bacterium]|nr:TonB family protein [Pyrinomonadaceae bacterium]
MLRIIRIFSLFTILACLQVSATFAQTVTQGKAVKWDGLRGNNNEFIVFMPQDYITTADDEYYLGKGTRVEKQLKVARYINGVVLLMEYYKGKAKDIYDVLKEREKGTLEKEVEINGFQAKHFSLKSEKSYRKTHFYIKDKSVYVLKGYAKVEDDKILKGFFESVRLINQENVVAPNAPPNSKTTSLPNLIEQETPRLEDSATVDQKTLDRQVIILKSSRPIFSSETRQGLGNVRVKLKVLFSSSGKVTNVEVLEISSKLLEKEAIEAAKKTVFIPAEKDGKLVPSYLTVEYGFEIR